MHWSRAWPTLTANDCPGYSSEIDVFDRPQERFERDETCLGIDPLKMFDAAGVRCVFNRNAKPDVAWHTPASVTSTDVVTHERAALGQHLVHVPVRALHRIKHPINERPVNVLVEKVAHRIDENHPRPLPLARLLKPRRPQRQVEALLIRMTDDATPAFRKARRIAIVTPGSDLGATRHRVPSRIRPFNFRFLCHGLPQERPSLYPSSRLEQRENP